MPRTCPPLPLPVRRALPRLGADIRDARRRRRLPTAVLANRAGITLPTLRKVERGDPAVSLGIYATILFVLGMLPKLTAVAAVEGDAVGLTLEGERLPQRIRRRRAPGSGAGATDDQARVRRSRSRVDRMRPDRSNRVKSHRSIERIGG
jgi:transcriptional regulator with XRE-family HTH domain